MTKIRYADLNDFEILKEHDKHVSENELKRIIDLKRVLVMYKSGEFIGWLRFGMFWDNIPFMNMLYILDGHRRKGFGGELVRFWEGEMIKQGYRRALTSTQSDEQAQFFYRKMGYSDCGALLLPGETLEIFFVKDLRGSGGGTQ